MRYVEIFAKGKFKRVKEFYSSFGPLSSLSFLCRVIGSGNLSKPRIPEYFLILSLITERHSGSRLNIVVHLVANKNSWIALDLHLSIAVRPQ